MLSPLQLFPLFFLCLPWAALLAPRARRPRPQIYVVGDALGAVFQSVVERQEARLEEDFEK